MMIFDPQLGTKHFRKKLGLLECSDTFVCLASWTIRPPYLGGILGPAWPYLGAILGPNFGLLGPTWQAFWAPTGHIFAPTGPTGKSLSFMQ